MRFVRRAVALPLAGLVILISGCNESATTSEATVVHKIPATLSGELTSQSAVNMNDGSRYQRFQLELQADKVYKIVSSGALAHPRLLLLNEDNELTGSPGSGQLHLQVEQDGLYWLAASAGTATDFGPFRLGVTAVDVINEGELTTGTDLAGFLSTGPVAQGNRYTLVVAEQGLYEITLRSEAFDAVLHIQGNGLDRTDDDGAGGTDSRLLLPLAEGSYELTASGYGSWGAGLYSLSVAQQELPEGINLQDGDEIRPGEEYTGMLTGQSQGYSLQVEQPGLLQLSMRSEALDSVLELRGQGIHNRDDDSGGHLNALLQVMVEPGRYQIRASDYSDGSGLFTLQAELTEVEELAGAIVPGESRVGRLTAGLKNTARLTISEPGEYRITLRSSDFDAFLWLRGDHWEQSNDDSAGGTDAQLELWLEAGEYEIVNDSYSNQGAGNFVLSVDSADAWSGTCSACGWR